MKKCSSCKIEKHFSKFSWRIKAKKKRNTICKDCHKIYVKGHYYRNIEKYRIKAARNRKNSRKRNRSLVHELKHRMPCKDCGGRYPYWVMDYDHLNPKTKIDNVGNMAGSSLSEKRIKEEIAKCDLVCSNCHRERTHKRKTKMPA